MTIIWLAGTLFAGITADPVIQIKLTLLLALSINALIYWWLSVNLLLTVVFFAANVIGTIGLVYLDIFAGFLICSKYCRRG